MHEDDLTESDRNKPESSHNKGDYVEFVPPKGWMPPESSGDDSGEFDLVCTFKVKPGPKLCMTKLGDTPMPERKEKDKAPDYKQYGQSIVSATGPMDDSGSGMGY